MKASTKLGRLAGIDIYMHFSFLLILLWVAYVSWQRSNSLMSVLTGLLFVLLIFACVVLHEYGHALAARRYGIKTRDIILLPIGGVARLERIPTQPLQELWVALAGPAVNILIAAALFIWLGLTATLAPLEQLTLSTGSMLERLMAVNLFMVVFNLLPAFPMDGGRVLRALLATRTTHARATRIAARIGQAMAILFGFLGLFYYPLLLLIALFIWMGAAQEARLAKMKSAVGGLPIQQAMITEFQVLEASDTLERAVDLTLASSQKEFPVVNNGRLEGVLTQQDLMHALAQRNRSSTIGEALQRRLFSVDAREMLESVFEKFSECRCRTLPVTLEGELVGLVTLENVGEYVRLQSAYEG
ncbi:MAG: site-2 protease family protein [Desulfosarcinaceae bacterium]|nr:site-2 protease family protein [Desulfosarcinaceae bacterium]